MVSVIPVGCNSRTPARSCHWPHPLPQRSLWFLPFGNKIGLSALLVGPMWTKPQSEGCRSRSNRRGGEQRTARSRLPRQIYARFPYYYFLSHFLSSSQWSPFKTKQRKTPVTIQVALNVSHQRSACRGLSESDSRRF